MKSTFALTIAAVVVLALPACKTVSFNVTRQALYPSRKKGCHIDWVKIPVTSLGPTNPNWEVIGNIAFAQRGDVKIDDTLHRKIDNEACKLGGDAVSLGLSSTTQAKMRSGSQTMLMVLRKKKHAKKLKVGTTKSD